MPPSIAATRIGSDLLGADKNVVPVPVDLAATEIGANTLCGVRTSDGLCEQFTTAVAGDPLPYNKVLLATREFYATGTEEREAQGDRAHRGVEMGRTVKLNAASTISNAGTWLGATAYAQDHETVGLDPDDGGSPAVQFGEVGPVVDVDVENDQVYVFVSL